METNEPALAVIRALAAARQRLESAADETARFDLTVQGDEFLWINAELVQRRSDGREVGRYLSALNRLDGQGWNVGREVSLYESAAGESEVLGVNALSTVQILTTAELCADLPRLLGEVLDAPTPKPGGP